MKCKCNPMFSLLKKINSAEVKLGNDLLLQIKNKKNSTAATHKLSRLLSYIYVCDK